MAKAEPAYRPVIIVGDYAFSGNGAFGSLKERQIPISFCSEKPPGEIIELNSELGINYPFITESGAIYVPEGYFDLKKHKHEKSGDYHIIELNPEITPESPVEITKMKTLLDKLYDKSSEEFRKAINESGLEYIRKKSGGYKRGVERGRSTGILTELYRSKFGPKARVIGIGTGGDVPMLLEVDSAHFVSSPEDWNKVLRENGITN